MAVPDSNLIEGNLIGTDSTGTVNLGNHTDGVQLIGATNTLVGGQSPGSQNVISGNSDDGVTIANFGTTPSTNNQVVGNLIGTDMNGTAALGNGNGVNILDSSNNTVGGASTAARNVIAGNSANGIEINSDGTAPSSNNTIEGNYIGTDGTGATALPNAQNGIEIIDSTNNIVGGSGTAGQHHLGEHPGRGVDRFDDRTGLLG